MEAYFQSGKSQTAFAPDYGIKATKSKHAAQALSLFKNIFDSENRLRRLYENGKISESEFLQKRKEEVKPHMDKLHAWLVDKQLKSMILDSSKTKEAVEYCLRRWENLENYINYPEVTFSTNEALYEHYFYPHKFYKSA